MLNTPFSINNTPPTETYTLSLHDALPIFEAHALLAIEDGAAVLEPDGERDERQHGDHEGEQEEPRRRHDRVHAALDQAAPPLERNLGEVDDRRAVEILQRRLERGVLQDVGDELDLDQLAPHLLQRAEHLLVRLERQGDVDLVDALLLDDALDVLDVAEHRRRLERRARLAGVVVEVARHLQPQLAVVLQLARDLP